MASNFSLLTCGTVETKCAIIRQSSIYQLQLLLPSVDFTEMRLTPSSRVCHALQHALSRARRVRSAYCFNQLTTHQNELKLTLFPCFHQTGQCPSNLWLCFEQDGREWSNSITGSGKWHPFRCNIVW